MLTKLKKHIKSENGATSVLVIFMMIVLVTLGAFAITSTNVNYKYASQVMSRYKAYYSIDKDVEGYLMRFDDALRAAQKTAMDYMLLKNYANSSAQVLTAELQDLLSAEYLQATDKNKALVNIYDSVYFYFANENLSNFLANGQIGTPVITVYKDGDKITGIDCEVDFVSNDNPDLFIKLAVSVASGCFDFIELNNEITAVANGTKRYGVNDYYEWQTLPDIESGAIQFWDGTLDLK